MPDWHDEDDLEEALGGGGGINGPPQEMALLDKRPGTTLSDDASSEHASDGGGSFNYGSIGNGASGRSVGRSDSLGGSSAGGGPGNSKRSLLQPASLSSSHMS